MRAGCSRVTHPCAGRRQKYCYSRAAPRLACVRPAASVHPEPGSNSSSYNLCYISSCVPWLHLQFRYLYLELTLSVFGTSLVLSLSSLFNELPMPLRDVLPHLSPCPLRGLSEPLFPNGIAKVHLFSFPPNFFSVFLAFFSCCRRILL